MITSHYRNISIVLIILIGFQLFGKIKKQKTRDEVEQKINPRSVIGFIENKGQIYDQDFKSRNDILFSGSIGSVNYFLSRDRISYQFNRIEESQKKKDPIFKTDVEVPKLISIYRLDFNWIGANKNARIENGATKDEINNFYFQHCPNGIHDVRTYWDITYKNLYNGIDLHYFFDKNGNLKYEYFVDQWSSYEQIKIEVSGADQICIQSDGSILIRTEYGEIREEAPYAEQNGKEIISKWKLNGNILSFELENYNPSLPLLLDPIVRMWGTYYGGNNGDTGHGCSKDNNGNIFLTGATYSTNFLAIATVGSHKSTFNGQWTNAYLVKFNSDGIRLWGTYYGGLADGGAYSCAVDKNGNVFMCGFVGPESGTMIATQSCHQPVNAGGVYDSFLVKFNSNGVRQWGTYYGGPSEDAAGSCAVDTSGNVYITGNSSSSINISSTGCHQGALAGNYDAFLAKFDGNGVRLWGTYYGSISMEMGLSCATDFSGNVYMAGFSNSPTSNLIATTNSHQGMFGGLSDAFLVKFNAQGVRQWGTYYGGNDMDCGSGCATDSVGNIYLCGYTRSLDSNAISTFGSHQISYGGGTTWGDGFITKFNSSGIRLWGTYYGGSGEDWSAACSVENNETVYLVGTTNSDSINTISTHGSQQLNFGGGPSDAFVAAFDKTGQRIAGTYYGASGGEEGMACSNNPQGRIYMSGHTNSNSLDTLASQGSHQTAYGGGQIDAFLVKFSTCDRQPTVSISASNTLICLGETVILNAFGAISYIWNTLTSGSTLSVNPISTTIYTVVGEDPFGCKSSDSISIEVSLCTEISSLSQKSESLEAFPIPSDDHTIFIRNSFGNNSMIEFINTFGEVVFKTKLNEPFCSIDLSSLANGVYFLRIKGLEHSIKKIVLQ